MRPDTRDTIRKQNQATRSLGPLLARARAANNLLRTLDSLDYDLQSTISLPKRPEEAHLRALLAQELTTLRRLRRS